MTDHALPLTGVRVLSLAEQLPGPVCGLLLRELGADVTLLERPGVGDPQREVGTWLFRFASLDKKSVALDLKDPLSRSAAQGLAAEADVLVEGFRPGVADRLGLGYSELSASNPGLVYCSISGYGQTGPSRLLGGHNLNYEAVSGLLTPFALDHRLSYFTEAPPWGDVLSGVLSALAVVAALRRAESTGHGTCIDLSITDALVFAMGPSLTRHFNGGEAFDRREAGYGVFRCADGMLALGVHHEDHMWRALCAALGLEAYDALTHQQRLERADEIRAAIVEAVAHDTVDHWLEALGDIAACSRVNTVDDVATDPQLMTRGMFAHATTETGEDFLTVRSPLAPSDSSPGAVPALGADTRVVLESLGLEPAVVDEIVAHSAEIARRGGPRHSGDAG
ncbi:MAG TPA: CaiB/BaiF CoA-transferase family protein [Nocardioides sp.]|jgi:crotonobetainyl-CoA:carnitine CoA-transferase CaiB-like acyl-CoA transferase|uniref:CaiB/BaiF CoA transferase family protein n=1 Tax=Nocardioides sp. TaxID=35761 RepID=UPI002E346F06|nr:CaiB/BaiF CoA-transferase family protein [Nocardioides sp.]HEX3930502.1 CaiB/BaiF CoA-transferase family protein [Nocardioides sp.]